MPSILASLEDINANLPSQDEQPVIEASDENTDLISTSVARVVRGYLSGVIDNVTLMSWVDPVSTPETIREIAGMLIAAQLYFNFAARTSLTIEERNFAQLLYDKAIAMLQQIVDGMIIIPGIISVPPGVLTGLDYFPIDDTDRAFTMGMNL